ncbi:MAG: hypothetical protein SV253_01815 [Halobacteria archaeon]|nr:hypothetical protein [Halobacteria archaeon]
MDVRQIVLWAFVALILLGGLAILYSVIKPLLFPPSKEKDD